ncbi:hypothetical protein FKM82_024548 [Ascaphus truei]
MFCCWGRSCKHFCQIYYYFFYQERAFLCITFNTLSLITANSFTLETSFTIFTLMKRKNNLYSKLDLYCFQLSGAMFLTRV